MGTVTLFEVSYWSRGQTCAAALRLHICTLVFVANPSPPSQAYVARIRVNTLLADFTAVAADYAELNVLDPKKALEHQAKV